jgi:hypothetical protein
MNEPCSMSAMNEFQCPLTKKIFPFVLRDNASRKEALAQQQAHTGAEVQRLERLAGRELKYRELLKEADRERAVAKVAEMKAAEEAAKKPQEPDPFVEAIFGGCRSPDIR